MNIYLPQNIFSAIFALILPDKQKESVIIKPSSMISKALEEDKNSVGFIPSFDLLNHKDFFISKKTAVSFDGLLSASYFYFVPGQNKFNKIRMKGDVSSNEMVLTKILFKERYATDVEIIIDTSDELEFDSNNYLISGNINFENNYFSKGISFADQTAELIDYPFTHYLVASKNEEVIKSFTEPFDELDKIIEDKLTTILPKLQLGEDAQKFLSLNWNAVYFDLTKNEIEGLNELLRLPYFHGIVKDIVEVNFT